MYKADYKKTLIDIRNSFLDYKKILNQEEIIILEKSFIKQKEYLNRITFNLISSDNSYLNNMGRIIAYALLKNKTNKELIQISTYYFEEYDKVQNEIKRITKELDKISNVISFIDNINETEFEKYMSYKIN